MPSSKENRRKRYQEKVALKKQEAAKKQATEAAKLLSQLPKSSILKPPLKKDQVGGKQDHGGHQKALNFWQVKLCYSSSNGTTHVSNHVDVMSGYPESPGVLAAIPPGYKIKIGSVTFGFVYDGNWKADSIMAGKGERKMCKISEKHMIVPQSC